ncbi:MAG: hypothetical protein U0L77_10135 [Prevotellamassilia sp.]|nr:hypothetical protein [Prevotellamassilia sp.]
MRKAITTSTTILPIALVVGSVLWILPEAGNLLLWGGWFVALLTTYGWMEMNARLILLRERSRMVSTTVFTSLTAIPLLHYAQWESLLPLGLLVIYAFLFASYQERRPEGYLFYAFAILSTCSLVVTQLLWLLPLLLFCCLIQLRSLTLGGLSATVMGIILPVIILPLISIWSDDPTSLPTMLKTMGDQLVTVDFTYWKDIYYATPATLPHQEWQFLVTTGCVMVPSLIAIIHQVQTSYLDKTRVRMYYYLMEMTHIALFALLILFPSARWTWLHLLIVNSAPLIAHYMTLTRGWFATTIFWLSLTGLLLLTFFNYQTEWILSLIFS